MDQDQFSTPTVNPSTPIPTSFDQPIAHITDSSTPLSEFTPDKPTATIPTVTAPPPSTPLKKPSTLKPMLFNLAFACALLTVAAISLKLFLIDDQVPATPQELLNVPTIPSLAPSTTSSQPTTTNTSSPLNESQPTTIAQARNNVRVNDLFAVAKALETCYDVTAGDYGYQIGHYGVNAQASASGPFATAFNQCLTDDILPALDAYNYGISFSQDANGNTKYVLCADLEMEEDWERIINTRHPTISGTAMIAQTVVGKSMGGFNIPTYADITINDVNQCVSNTAITDGCMFCLTAQ